METPLLLVVVTLLAAFTQGAIGLGFALLVAPVAVVLFPPVEAVPILLLLNTVVAGVLIAPLWRDVQRALLGRLLVGALLGFPIGVWLEGSLDGPGLRASVAAIVVLTGALLLRSPRPAREHNPSWPMALLVGGTSGALTLSLGLAGPPLALFVAWTGMPKVRARALILTLYVPLYGSAFLTRAAYEGVAPAVWSASLWLAPVAVLGAGLGHVASSRIDEVLFRRVLLILVMGSGAYLLISTLVG